MTRYYLSGPMTGLPALNFPAFHAAADALRLAGLEVVNPAELNPDPGTGWADCLRTDLRALLDCQAIAMLPGWEGSRGARLEHHVAEQLGMSVHLVADLLAVPA